MMRQRYSAGFNILNIFRRWHDGDAAKLNKRSCICPKQNSQASVAIRACYGCPSLLQHDEWGPSSLYPRRARWPARSS